MNSIFDVQLKIEKQFFLNQKNSRHDYSTIVENRWQQKTYYNNRYKSINKTIFIQYNNDTTLIINWLFVVCKNVVIQHVLNFQKKKNFNLIFILTHRTHDNHFNEHNVLIKNLNMF